MIIANNFNLVVYNTSFFNLKATNYGGVFLFQIANDFIMDMSLVKIREVASFTSGAFMYASTYNT